MCLSSISTQNFLAYKGNLDNQNESSWIPDITALIIQIAYKTP